MAIYISAGVVPATIAAWLCVSAASAQDRAFAIRADPSRAALVQEVLADVARPFELLVSAGQDPAAALRERCGDKLPTGVELRPVQAGEVVTYPPCLRTRTDRTVTVQKGQMLETIARKYGLHPSAVGELAKRVTSPDGANRRTGELFPGDLVTIPSIPEWTPFVAAPPWNTREAIAGALAERLGCGGEPAEGCLLRLGVFLLDRGLVESNTQVEPSLLPPDRVRNPGVNLALRPPGATIVPLSARRVAIPRRRPLIAARREPSDLLASAARRLEADRAASSAPTASENAAGDVPFETTSDLIAAAPAANSGTEAVVAMVDPDAVPEEVPSTAVADGQWPYDVARVRAALTLAAQQEEVKKSVVGIADNGLRDRNGAPLPPVVFANLESTQEDPGRNGAEAVDDDGDGYADNSIGAGLPRSNELGDLSVDIALCGDTPPPNYSILRAAEQFVVSHGAVVASLAAGVQFLGGAPEVGPVLPKIFFFRTADGCDPRSIEQPDVLAYAKAVGHLAMHADVISFSHVAVDNNGDVLAEAISGIMDGTPDLMLIMPAGNNQGVDLEEFGSPPCLPCLVDPLQHGKFTPPRVLVIGAAERTLQRARFSSYGLNTVKLYAPGEPSGAVGISGENADHFQAATSWAVPRTAFAAGLLRSLGVPDATRIRERLRLASWPLLDQNGTPSVNGARVIDITKVAAVRTYAVEAIVTEHGRPVRKTWVGDLLTPLHELAICGSGPIRASQVQAIQLERSSDPTIRYITSWTRHVEGGLRFRTHHKRAPCVPAGSLRIHDVLEGEVTIPLRDITNILVPW